MAPPRRPRREWKGKGGREARADPPAPWNERGQARPAVTPTDGAEPGLDLFHHNQTRSKAVVELIVE